jgi:hypothetical protein
LLLTPNYFIVIEVGLLAPFRQKGDLGREFVQALVKPKTLTFRLSESRPRLFAPSSAALPEGISRSPKMWR